MYYQQKVFRGDTSAIRVDFDDILIPIEGVIHFIRKNNRLSEEVLSLGERLTDKEERIRSINVFRLGVFHCAYAAGLISYVFKDLL